MAAFAPATPIRLAALVRQSRLDKGITLRDLARELGMAPSTLADIENDRLTPADDVITSIARVLKASAAEFQAADRSRVSRGS